jgi:hypothetical protein
MLPDEAAGSPGNRRFALWLKKSWVAILLAIIALGYSGTVTLMHTNGLSPIDEWVYSDYLDKVPTEVVVKQGEVIGPEALNRIACDGVVPYGTMGAECGASYSDLSKFPFKGRTSADGYTPVYFISTWAVGGVIRLITHQDELTSWRLTSPIWLAGTLLIMVALFRRYHIDPLVTITLGVAFIVSPFAWWTYTYVSTDAPSAFFGALLLLQATRFVRHETRGWWLLATSCLAVLFKLTNILAVCLVGLILVLIWLQEVLRARKDEDRGVRLGDLRRSMSLPLIGAAAVAASVITELVWLEIRRVIAVVPQAQQGLGEPLSGRVLGGLLANFLPGTITSNVVVTGSGGNYALPVLGAAVAPLSWLCVAGVVGAFWSAGIRRSHGPIVVATAIASVGFAPMLAVALTFAIGAYFELPARYGATILPGILLVTALTMRRRFAAWVFLVYAVLLGIGMLVLTAALW